MQIAELDGIHLHWRSDGPEDGLPVVLSNILGLDLRMWEPLLPCLPRDWRILRYDRRGHGLSDVPPGPYRMGQLITETEALLDHLGLRGCVFVGASIGGMVAQGLAVKRPDLIRALVLSTTAARIATAEIWSERIAQVAAHGMGALAEPTLERWFTADFRARPAAQLWRNMLLATPPAGWMGCAAAISGSDFYSTTAGLRLPTLGIAGERDGSTPPDLVRETAELVPGARFALIRRTGHLPQIEAPEAYAGILRDFVAELPAS